MPKRPNLPADTRFSPMRRSTCRGKAGSSRTNLPADTRFSPMRLECHVANTTPVRIRNVAQICHRSIVATHCCRSATVGLCHRASSYAYRSDQRHHFAVWLLLNELEFLAPKSALQTAPCRTTPCSAFSINEFKAHEGQPPGTRQSGGFMDARLVGEWWLLGRYCRDSCPPNQAVLRRKSHC